MYCTKQDTPLSNYYLELFFPTYAILNGPT